MVDFIIILYYNKFVIKNIERVDIIMVDLFVLLFVVGVCITLFFGSAFMVFLLQFISYRIFKFNLYKKVVLPLIK